MEPYFIDWITHLVTTLQSLREVLTSGFSFQAPTKGERESDVMRVVVVGVACRIQKIGGERVCGA